MPFGEIWALVAVASATFLTRYANVFALGFLSRKYLGIGILFKDIFKPLISALIMLAFLWGFNWLFNPGIWLSMAMIALAAGVYFVSMFLLEPIVK
jgi:hypothetical protein